MSNDLISRRHFGERVRRVVNADKELSADYLNGVDMVLYLLLTEPAVPQEMSAREYEKAFQRITYEDVETYRVWWEAIHDEDWGRAVAIVEKWAKEHPATDTDVGSKERSEE